jgi:hypothetical protein
MQCLVPSSCAPSKTSAGVQLHSFRYSPSRDTCCLAASPPGLVHSRQALLHGHGFQEAGGHWLSAPAGHKQVHDVSCMCPNCMPGCCSHKLICVGLAVCTSACRDGSGCSRCCITCACAMLQTELLQAEPLTSSWVESSMRAKPYVALSLDLYHMLCTSCGVRVRLSKHPLRLPLLLLP